MKGKNGYQQEAQLFQALSHPVRVRILDILSRQEACVCHLTAILGKRQPYVSQQLAALREAGLVTDRRDGTLIYYSLADDRLTDLLAKGRSVLQDIAEGELAFPTVPEEVLDNCTCPRCQK